MATSSDQISVFVSSTSKDLEDYRAVARNVILELGWRPEMMEFFTGQPEPTVEACRKKVEQCDMMLLLIAWRQGWVPTKEQGGDGENSITYFELQQARDKKKPVLVLMANEDWPGKLWENDAAKRKWVENFRDNLNQIAVFFAYEQTAAKESERLPFFRATLRENLTTYKEKITATRAETGASGGDYFRQARKGLFEGAGIPVVGSGIYQDGALTSEALATALLDVTDSPVSQLFRQQFPLATAAECNERDAGSRDQFLKTFRQVLARQQAQAERPPILDLLTSLNTLSNIVSLTYDTVLEKALEEAGQKYTVVAHVLRSADCKSEGCLLVLRPGEKAAFCRPDQLHLEPDERVLYKPQGSPFLHDTLDPDLEIDTVVVTETDHAMFLRRLESPETGIPGALKKRFGRWPLLFLGYTMDVWQYRLMVCVFQLLGRQDRRTSTWAVRIPDNKIEEVAWKTLNADLVRMDANQFARSAQTPVN